MKQQIAHVSQLELWVVKSSQVRKLDDNVQQGHQTIKHALLKLLPNLCCISQLNLHLSKTKSKKKCNATQTIQSRIGVC